VKSRLRQETEATGKEEGEKEETPAAVENLPIQIRDDSSSSYEVIHEEKVGADTSVDKECPKASNVTCSSGILAEVPGSFAFKPSGEVILLSQSPTVKSSP
jgi:hypothetical protein